MAIHMSLHEVSSIFAAGFICAIALLCNVYLWLMRQTIEKETNELLPKETLSVTPVGSASRKAYPWTSFTLEEVGGNTRKLVVAYPWEFNLDNQDYRLHRSGRKGFKDLDDTLLNDLSKRIDKAVHDINHLCQCYLTTRCSAPQLIDLRFEAELVEEMRSILDNSCFEIEAMYRQLKRLWDDILDCASPCITVYLVEVETEMEEFVEGWEKSLIGLAKYITYFAKVYEYRTYEHVIPTFEQIGKTIQELPHGKRRKCNLEEIIKIAIVRWQPEDKSKRESAFNRQLKTLHKECVRVEEKIQSFERVVTLRARLVGGLNEGIVLI